MRRGSLVGPLLLILIGLWFLMSTLRPELPLLDLAARFWPFLLIGWGALRLLEIVSWAVRGRAMPRSGVSGGEWTLVVFICLIGSGLYAASRYRPWSHFGMIGANPVEIFGRSFDYPVAEQKTDAGKATRVMIEDLRGSVRVAGVDGNQVTVSGRKSIRAMQDKDADDANRQTPVEISTQGDVLVIRTNQDRVTGDQRVTTDLDISIPRALGVEVRGRNNDSIDVSDLGGGVNVTADSASVRLENIGGNVQLDVRKSDLLRSANVKGKVQIQGGRGRDIELDTIAGEVLIDGSYSGDLRMKNLAGPLRFQGPNSELKIEKVPGIIHMDLGKFDAANVVGPIRIASTRAWDVQLEQFRGPLELSLDHGDINLRPMETPLAKIDARTRNGQVDIALPETAAFDLKAVTNHGEINNDFGGVLRTVPEDRDRPGRHGGSVVGSTGNGPSIVVQTDRGSLTVRKDSGKPPEPPKPPSPPAAPPEIEQH
jgi:DUF4097 and DUF4098 domain-containing protein YvlB